MRTGRSAASGLWYGNNTADHHPPTQLLQAGWRPALPCLCGTVDQREERLGSAGDTCDTCRPAAVGRRSVLPPTLSALAQLPAGSVPSVSAFCADDTLYCQSFPQGVLLSNASVALLSYTGPPALCLPKPVVRHLPALHGRRAWDVSGQVAARNRDLVLPVHFHHAITSMPGPLPPCTPDPQATCGVAGAPCCPLTGNATDLSLRCTDADTICLTDPSFSANLTGLLTAADYQRLLADPNATLSEAEQRSVWGSCQTFPADTCGAPQGLCGPRLPAPATQCPQEVQGGEEGYFCQLQEGQLQQVGLCEPVPEGAGKLGSQVGALGMAHALPYRCLHLLWSSAARHAVPLCAKGE